MSELKAITAYEANWKATSNGDNSVLVYLKSEADKVIAHHKYKRCLAMARWCESRSNKLFEDTLYVRDMGLEPSDELTFKLEFFRKWYKRWLKLAEKFKEAE